MLEAAMSDRKRGRPPETDSPDHQSQSSSFLPEQWMPLESGRSGWEDLPPPGPQGGGESGGGLNYSAIGLGLAAHAPPRLPPSPRSRPFLPPAPHLGLELPQGLSLDLSYPGHHASAPPSGSSASAPSPASLSDGLRLLAVASRAAPPPLYASDPSSALPLSDAPPRHPADAPGLGPSLLELSNTMREALVKETVSRAFLGLAMQGLADGGKTYMFIRRWQVSRARLEAEDPSNGLHEAVTWAERQGKLVFSDDAKDDDHPTHSVAFLHELPEDANNDLSSCRVWSACVGERELVVRCSHGFAHRFFNAQHLVNNIRDTRQLCVFVWARLMSEEEDLRRFYSALMEVMFSRSTAATNIIINKCRERVGGERRCLMRLSFHSCVLADGRTFNGYQVQVWPLGHAPLRHPPPLNIGQDPAPPMVV